MSGKFSRISISRLFSMMMSQYDRYGSIFGIPSELFFKPDSKDLFRYERFGIMLDTPFGVAAGPHTQMAQNIIASWLCGARYIELKTVQTLDELEIPKPCIDMQDEGYNCEWSQELKIKDAVDEYLNAWVLIHILQHKLGYQGDPGIVFNMSVGYNMEGILKENVQSFLQGMADASESIAEKINELERFYPQVTGLNIPGKISDSITLSTMHGCPPGEIEKIGLYLIKEKKFNTVIKLNPTLLGPESLRSILNGKLRFDTVVPDEAFDHDLRYSDALQIIDTLGKAARENHVHFGLKLTNTLESLNHRGVFPPAEKTMYMSGRALHPISVHLAQKLQEDFDGLLDISFSAGADCYNICDILSCGLAPVTVCSDILKPGGYGRLAQYITALRDVFAAAGARSIADLMIKTSGEKQVETALLYNLRNYAPKTLQNRSYQKDPLHLPDIKTSLPLLPFDCIAAPCTNTCPSEQEIPQYLYHASRGETAKGLEVILRTNPFPNVCGMVCDHICTNKCTRVNYDSPLLIREVKRYLSENAKKSPLHPPENLCGPKTAIIGAGPSGLACAYFLRLAGFRVTVCETKAFAGGMISDAIPAFRLTAEAIEKDINAITELGVEIKYSSSIDKKGFAELQSEHDFIYIAVGAQKAKKLGISGEDLPNVLDPLQFLSEARQRQHLNIGRHIAVIGGGNTAMDVARTCRRLAGKQSEVTLVYRRSRNEMPAEPDEVQAALDDGIKLLELVSPVRITQGKSNNLVMHCLRMELKGKDASGRNKPVAVNGSGFEMVLDTIIPAPGQETIVDFIGRNTHYSAETFETSIENVYIGGDAARGGSTIIRAIGDGRRAAASIMAKAKMLFDMEPLAQKETTARELLIRRSQRMQGMSMKERPFTGENSFSLVSRTLNREEAEKEASRCLYCDELCNICVTVCPNRANISYTISPLSVPVFEIDKIHNKPAGITRFGTVETRQETQTANIVNFCNECGNCTTFCPTSGSPFRDKPRIHLTQESFQPAADGYLISSVAGKTLLMSKIKGKIAIVESVKEGWIYEDPVIRFKVNADNYEITDITFYSEPKKYITQRAAMMIILYKGLIEVPGLVEGLMRGL